jgi:hypothetical protein
MREKVFVSIFVFGILLFTSETVQGVFDSRRGDPDAGNWNISTEG